MDTPPPESAVPPVKAIMREWSAKNPQAAAERLATRQLRGEQRKQMARFSELIGGEMIEKAAERLCELLDAEGAVVVSNAEGAGQITMVPDNKTRLEAIKVVAAYSEGLPVARQMVLHGDFKDLTQEKQELMMQCDTIREALAEIEEECTGTT